MQRLANIQHGAAMQLRPGDIGAGWTLVAIVNAHPWPWCLLERGNALGRMSPRHFLSVRGSDA